MQWLSQIKILLLIVYRLSTVDSVLDYGNNNWLVKYKYKQSYNVLRYRGDLHVMNKKCILDTDLYNKLWNSV